MTLTSNFNQIKAELSSFLLSCNLNNNQINEILSDEFINGILDHWHLIWMEMGLKQQQ